MSSSVRDGSVAGKRVSAPGISLFDQQAHLVRIDGAAHRLDVFAENLRHDIPDGIAFVLVHGGSPLDFGFRATARINESLSLRRYRHREAGAIRRPPQPSRSRPMPADL